MNNEHAAIFVPEAVAYLEGCRKPNPKDGRYAKVLRAPVADAAKIRAGLRRVLDAMRNAIGGDTPCR